MKRVRAQKWPSPLVYVVVLLFVSSLDAVCQTQRVTDKNQEPNSLGDPEVVISGNQSVVRYSTLLWDNLPLTTGNNRNFMCFSVSPVSGPVSNARVTSTGLGRAVFGLLAKGQPCTGDAPGGVEWLALPELKSESSVSVWMRFPRELIDNTGDSVEGKILIVAPQKKSLEAPLKIETPSWSPLFTALLWSVGVIIPAIIALVLGYEGNKFFSRWQTRSAEFGALSSYITANYDALRDNLTVSLDNVMKNQNQDFPERMRVALAADLWAAIPKKEAEDLRFAIARCQREAIRIHLARLFPDWSEQIAGIPQGRLRRYLWEALARLR